MADHNTFGIAGLLGWPVGHSRSPVIHNHWLARYGIPGRYVLFGVPPDVLPAAVKGLAALRLRGCNVTTPHKQAVIPLCSEVGPEAAAAASVNTLLVRDEGIRGESTDGRGLLWALGDVTGIWPLTTTGKYQGDVVAANILGEPVVAFY